MDRRNGPYFLPNIPNFRVRRIMERQTMTTGTVSHKPFLRLFKIIVLFAFSTLLIFGCASTTQIVLIPDPDGKVGVLDISTEKGSQTLSQAWQATESESMNEMPGEPKILEEKDVRHAFREALALEPVQPEQLIQQKPVQPEQPIQQKVVQPEQPIQQKVVQPATFIIYFMANNSDLSEESIAELSKVLEAIQSRKSAEIIVSGHTDAVGSSKYNHRLSLKRAQTVANFLVAKSIDRKIIQVTYHGKDKLLVPTPDNVPELRNRRVEITAR
jgi:outer membrane protein OmpA-like peptidoglycan-associated protein